MSSVLAPVVQFGGPFEVGVAGPAKPGFQQASLQ